MIMQSAIIKPNQQLKSLLNSQIGYVRVNYAFEHVDNSFENAAWSETSEVRAGIYALLLKQNTFAPHQLLLEASLQADVVEDFFPAMYAGVAVGGTKSTNRNKTKQIRRAFDLVDSIENTGTIPGQSQFDVVVHPFVWDEVISSAHDCIKELRLHMDLVWQHYDANDRYALNSINYCCQNIAQLAKSIDRILFHKNFTSQSHYNRELAFNNVSWVQEAA